jgi:hypothetical protein
VEEKGGGRSTGLGTGRQWYQRLSERYVLIGKRISVGTEAADWQPELLFILSLSLLYQGKGEAEQANPASQDRGGHVPFVNL